MLESSGVIPVKKMRKLGHVYVWLSFILLFVIFRADTLGQAGMIYSSMFTGFTMNAAQQTLLASCLNGSVIVTLAAAALCAMPWGNVFSRIRCRTEANAVGYIFSLGLLWLSLMSLASQSYNPFIYFRF